MQEHYNKTALLLGATGLVGGALLQQLLNDPRYKHITCFLRRPLSAKVIDKHGDKIRPIVVDFDHLEDYESYFDVDHVYVCLGTTIKIAKTKEAFRKVDFDYVLQAAKSSAGHCESFVWISSVGANANSSNFYLKVKGELQNAIESIPELNCAQSVEPSLLLGKRPEFRLGEWFGIKVCALLAPLFVGPLKKYRPIEAETVAQQMTALQKW